MISELVPGRGEVGDERSLGGYARALDDTDNDRSDEAERQKRSKHVQSHHQFHRRLQYAAALCWQLVYSAEKRKAVPKLKAYVAGEALAKRIIFCSAGN